jgi:hypothetical protein
MKPCSLAMTAMTHLTSTYPKNPRSSNFPLLSTGSLSNVGKFGKMAVLGHSMSAR